jgi:hypothetical protein
MLILAFVIGFALASVIPLRHDRVAAPPRRGTLETVNARWPAGQLPGGRAA